MKERGFLSETALSELKSSGIDFSLDEKDLFDVSVDHSRYSFIPDVLVKIKEDSEIGKVLSIANSYDIPVHIRGGGTGCSGGALAASGGWVVSLAKLDFIEIDPDSRVAHVGAGAITAKIDEEASKFGLFYAPDPSSHKFCSIGGNISCNAGGLRAAKYGTTRENVLALSAYLSDGTKIKCGLPLKKYSCGTNLRDLFIGSEGTLGVVSEAWLRLLPKPEFKGSVLAFFDGDSEAFAKIRKFLLEGFEPSVMEFLDSETVSCLRAYDASFKSIPEGSSAILVQFDGSRGQVEDDCEKLERFYEKEGVKRFRRAKEEGEEEEIWRVRRLASQAMYLLGNSKINRDIVLPVSALEEFFSRFKKAGREAGFPSPVFGHACDGNYHIHAMYNKEEEGARRRAEKFADSAVRLAVELGGAVSGEHGIGILKAKYMSLQHSEAELAAMKKIKEALDPHDILNRGQWGKTDVENREPIVGLKLPWD